MANYRTTVILKTDIVDSTPRLAEQTQTEMGAQRKQHKQFISETAAQHRGSIFDEEGDAYWIEFPSVTDATLAAIDMHQNLRSQQAGKGEKQRLAIRAVITVGDILHQEKDTIGMTMSQTVRIEKFTPPDEIYLSHAAWLVLNKAEVQTSLVGEFDLKGFSESEKVYKVEHKSGIRILTDQYIVLADAQGFTDFTHRATLAEVEKFLIEYGELMNDICAKHAGVIHQVNGDLYIMTFLDMDQAISAIKALWSNWAGILKHYQVGISVGAHKGTINLYRSYLFSEDINATAILSDFGKFYKADEAKIFVAASGKIRDEARGTEYERKFQELEAEKIKQENFRDVIRKYGAFRFLIEDDQ